MNYCQPVHDYRPRSVWCDKKGAVLTHVAILAVMAARATAQFEINIPETSWAVMATCTIEQKRLDAAECDYQPAQFRYGTEAWLDCEVKRKGSSTWRDMGEKPSFKIKADENFVFGEFDCTAPGAFCTGYNPASFLAGKNTWESKKVTLNNMVVGTNGADAYRIFRELGVVSPLSHWVTVNLYRSSVLQRSSLYNMIETINDKTFMRKYFADDYLLMELEGAVPEHKRSGGALKDIPDLQRTAIMDQAGIAPLSATNHHNLLRYAVGEKLTTHWDGWCKDDDIHNVYVAYVNNSYFYIPHGVDQTLGRCITCNNCPPNAVLAVVPNLIYTTECSAYDKCAPIAECMSNTTCAAEYRAVETAASPHRGQLDCTTWPAYLVFAGILLGAIVVVGYVAYKIARPAPIKSNLSAPLL